MNKGVSERIQDMAKEKKQKHINHLQQTVSASCGQSLRLKTLLLQALGFRA